MMQISPEIQLFIREHSSDDVRALALQVKKYPDIDMPTAITQIAGRKVAAEKIPSWWEIEKIWYPKHLSLEQCSSEITARYVDIYKALDDIARERKLTPEERQEQKKYAKLADSFTPLAKGMNSEYANQNAYDCIQIHGGSGFMMEYACQRIYRDARITSIYEGTTQLQTVAAIRYVTNGSYIATIREFEAIPCSPEMEPLMSRLKKMADKFEASTNAVKEVQDQELLDFTARKLVEMAADIIMCHLLIQDASKSSELFSKSAHVYLNYAEAEVEKHANFIENFDKEDLAFYKK